MDAAPLDAHAAASLAEAALRRGEHAELARLLQEHSLTLVAGARDRLEAVLGAVPDEVLAEHPGLAAGRHALPSFFDQDKPRGGLELAALVAEGSGTPVGDLVLLGLGRILALRSTDRFTEGLSIVERDRARVEADRVDWLEVPGHLRSIVLLQWGLTRLLAQDLPGALRDFQESYWAGRRSQAPYFARNGAINAALVLALLDSLNEASTWLAHGRQLERAPEDLRTIVEEWDPLVDSLVAMSRADLDGARESLSRFRPATDTELSWSIEHFVRARLRLLGGELDAGLDGLERAHHPRGRPIVPGSIDEALLTSVHAELALAAGRLPHASALLEGLDPGPVLAVVRTRLALLSGDLAGALASSAAGLTPGARLGRVDLVALGAVALWRMGRHDEAADELRRAIEISRSRGVLAPFSLLPREDLLALLELVPEGAAPLEPALARTAPRPVIPRGVVELSDRERRILVELARPGSIQDIAGRLFVSVNTVKSQVRSIYRKLDVSSREEALEVARRWGFDGGLADTESH